MAIEIRAIQCPNCGSPLKTELKPGDFRCDSCGTEYFLDDGSVTITPPSTGQQKIPEPPAQKSINPFFWLISVLITTIFIVARIASFFTGHTTSAASSSPPADDNNWSSKYELLYLTADGKPVEITSGTNRSLGNSQKTATDYIAFYDLIHQKQINRIPLPDAGTRGYDRTHFEVIEILNDDIYIVANKKLIFLVAKGTYLIKDVTKTLFANQHELDPGIAKTESLSKDLGQGFKLLTNDGKQFVYLPGTNKLYTQKAFDDLRAYFYYYRHPVPDAIEQTGVDFTRQNSEDNDGVGARLMTYHFTAPIGIPSYFFPEFLANTQDTAAELKKYGISAYRELTPGRIYFAQRVVYHDSNYVLINYKPTPADDAKHYIQCLNAQTGTIIFTTEWDDQNAPAHCIRYASGFALEADPNIFLITLDGKTTTKYSHLMGQHQ